MLLPEFTIRSLLVLTAVCGVFFSIVALAVRGVDWAIGLTVPVVIVAAASLFQMLSYALALWLGRLQPSPRADRDVSDPFASTDPSEQLMPPQEQEW